MALKIRLARGGAKKRPFYRIVVAEASAPRDGRYVERVGTYNPMVPKEHEQRMTLNSERITFWLGQGAKPTDRVHKMLAAAGLAEAPVIRDQPKKSAPGKKRAEREAEAASAAEAAAASAAADAAEAEEAAAAAPAEEAPAEEAVAEEAPAEEAPAEEAVAEEAPAEEAPAEEAVAEEAPAEEAPAEEAVAEEAPADEAAAEEKADS
jgi:small subunit ribosomal protein S16